MKTGWFQNAVTAVLCLCALLVTALVVRRELFVPAPAAARAQATRVQEWREFARAGHRVGPADARAVMVVFADFQCPFCAVAAERLREVRDRYPDEVAIVYRHFPLPRHPHAIAAAGASECAAAQGRFEPFHDALYAQQDSIGSIPWTRFAATAGVSDTAAFRRCTEAGPDLALLERDREAGDRLEMTGTPTILVNDMMLRGAPSTETLMVYVRRALRTRA